ncbi:MAG: hypothetical protein KGI39_03330 [Patescibacteria group bacterium]|nr:hypothetical protein [Patescibacteria group bacterium]
MALKDICESLKLNKETEIDDDLKTILKEFLRQTYQNHTETIDLINQISSYVSVSDCYRKIMERLEVMEKFLDDWRWIFIKVGIINENEIDERKEIIANFGKLFP